MGAAGTPMGALALATAVAAGLLLLHHLIFRPQLKGTTRLKLLFGLGVFPFIAAVSTTVTVMERTTERSFCGSCHVMGAHLKDVEDPGSMSLASRHARNPMNGGHACYVCHADYGMLGYPLTKLKGMGHVYNYYLGGYGDWELPKFLSEVRVAKPYPNANCQQCHSGQLKSFIDVQEHRAMKEELAGNRVSCASAGCHGVAHPFSKRPEEL